IAKYEGTLDKFMGDAMMVLFGAPVAHENDPERAVRAAVEMQTAMASFNRSRTAKRLLPNPLQISIAINSGRVFAGNVGSENRAEYTIMGENVNLAYRIESIAEPGQVVVSENTEHKVCNLFRFQSLGEFKFKGIRSPTPVYLVIGEKEKGLTPIPAFAGMTPLQRRGPLFGRTKELALIKNKIQDLEKGNGSILTFLGDAGVGKSRLIAELEEICVSRKLVPAFAGMTPLRRQGPIIKTECVSFGHSLAYAPFISILKTLFGLTDTDSNELRIRKIKTKLTELGIDQGTGLPILASLLGTQPSSLPKTAVVITQKKTFALIQDILLRATRLSQIRVLIIEDLHWLDKTSSELLTDFIAKVTSVPLLLCLSGRTEFQPAWITQPQCTCIRLEKLAAEDTKQLTSFLLNTEKISPELVNLVLEKSEGNPLFIEELTRNLTESHLTERVKDQVTLAPGVSSLAIPDTIDQVLMSRLDRLEEPVRLVAQYASVIGKQFSFPILQELVSLDTSLLNKFLDQLQTAGIMQKLDGDYAFYHGMITEVAYQSLLVHHRRLLHGKVGNALERFYTTRIQEHYETLAYHFYLSNLIDKAISYLGLAGDKTRKFYANAEAIEYYGKEIDLVDKLPRARQKEGYLSPRNDALKWQGEIWRLIGEPNKALLNYTRLLQYTKRIKDTSAQAEALKNIGLVYFDRGEYRQALRYYQNSLRLWMQLNDATGQAATLNNIGVIYLNLGKYQEAMNCYYTCLKVAEQSNDKKWQAHALNNLALTCRERGEYQKAETFCQRAL
ncbi:MAG: adenylate/guanylate cyclase domain-containing protein, partial [bacterium]|nr:adenylate/guanylate cyclase domain-containing protein [bacterium]